MAAQPKSRFIPATMTWAEAADYAFRKSESWLRHHLKDEELSDFPRPDPLFGVFAKAAVDDWLDRRFGTARNAPRDWTGELIERTRSGKGARKVSGRKAA